MPIHGSSPHPDPTGRCGRRSKSFFAASFALALLGPLCDTARAAIGDDDAARFLTMATFGPTAEDVAQVKQLGYRAWIDAQLALPATLQRPKVQAEDGDTQLKNPGQGDRLEAWFANALTAPDQLRQRAAWALSQIFVVTYGQSKLQGDPVAMAEFYDVLARDAFGYVDDAGVSQPSRYETLLYDVTRSPAMAKMLTYLRNEAGDDALGTSPDENYAREVMQLFALGLTLRNPDFSEVLRDGAPVPTYTQATVGAYAQVFTGWSYTSGYNSNPIRQNWKPADYQPVICYDKYHDEQHAKTLLSYSGRYGDGSDAFVLPAHNGCENDLQQGLAVIAHHPNVAPFVSRQLIQRFTTSNPSPQYIARVSAVFDDDGHGAYGNLGAVIKAILLDPEAKSGVAPAPYVFGKAREPLLKLTAFYRAYHAAAPNGRYELPTSGAYLQTPMGAPSVFNFYLPDYLPPGELGEARLYAPELQIVNQNSAITAANDLRQRTQAYLGRDGLNPQTPRVDLRGLAALAGDPAALADQLDHDLLYGRMSAPMHDTLVRMLGRLPADNAYARVTAAVHLVLISPEFAVQK